MLIETCSSLSTHPFSPINTRPWPVASICCPPLVTRPGVNREQNCELHEDRNYYLHILTGMCDCCLSHHWCSLPHITAPCADPAQGSSSGTQSWQCRRLCDLHLQRGTASHFTACSMLKIHLGQGRTVTMCHCILPFCQVSRGLQKWSRARAAEV